jgi:hypothetical protein
MKKLFLVLAVLGFIIPNIYTLKVSLETGNWLFWLDPKATLDGMFGNDTSTAFILDLLVAVWVFFIWSFFEAKKLGIKNVWLYWVLTLLFGIAGPLPLFLYARENAMSKNQST